MTTPSKRDAELLAARANEIGLLYMARERLKREWDDARERANAARTSDDMARNRYYAACTDLAELLDGGPAPGGDR